MVEDGRGTGVLRGSCHDLSLVADFHAFDLNRPIIVQRGLVDEVDVIDVGKYLVFIPPDLFLIYQRSINASVRLYRIVAPACRL